MLKYPEKLLYTSTLIVSLSYKDDDKLKEHDIIKNIKKKDDISNVTHLTGYIADSPVKDCVRLFTTLDFDDCVDIPRNKIIHVEQIPKDRMEFGGTCVWVSKDTELTYTKMERSKIEAQFLEGKIMEDYLPLAEDEEFMADPALIGTIIRLT